MEIDTKALAPIKTRVTQITKVVSGVVVKDDKTLEKAAVILKTIADVKKQVLLEKKKRLDPLKESIQHWKDFFAPLEASYADADRQTRSAVADYTQKVEDERLEAEKKAAAKIEKGSVKPETAQKQLEKTPEAKKTIRTKTGGTISVKSSY